MDKKEISEKLSLMSKLFEIKGENSFKVKAFDNASRIVLQIEDFENSFNSGFIGIKGIGKSISSVIDEFYTKGSSQVLDSLLLDIPKGVIDMLELKGLGAKKVKILYEELGITSVGELEYACNENRLLILKGFGEKTQTNIIKSIQMFKKRETTIHYPYAKDRALELLKELHKIKSVTKAAFTGDLRRKCETLSLLQFVISTGSTEDIIRLFNKVEHRDKMFINGKEVECLNVKADNFPVLFYICDNKDFNEILFFTSAEENFLSRFKNIDNFKNEKTFFTENNSPYIIPEMRENYNYQSYSGIIGYSQFKGVFHIHTTYSDGADSIEDIVKECISRGFDYIGISDHSKSAFYANGLSEDAIKRQSDEIDELNNKFYPFKIFKGVESDILRGGELDYSDKILEKFDFIIASVHSSFNLPKGEMTDRLIKAVKNPYTTIIGHPTGRLLLYREPYNFDFSKFLIAVKDNRKFIEINAHPYRLDLSWQNCIEAKKLGIKFFINPDAHTLEGFQYLKYGVNVARKAGLLNNDVLNTLSSEDIVKLLKK